MMKYPIQGLLVMLFLTSFGCSQNVSDKDKEAQVKHIEAIEMSEIEKKLLEVSRDHIENKYPESLALIGNPHMREINKGIWIITYKMPEDMIGGLPVVYIDESTFEVIKSYHEQ